MARPAARRRDRRGAPRLLALGALDEDGPPDRPRQGDRRFAAAAAPRPYADRGRARGWGRTAAEVAVLLSERGLGGNDADLELRLRRWRGERGQRRRRRAGEARSQLTRRRRKPGQEPDQAGPEAWPPGFRAGSDGAGKRSGPLPRPRLPRPPRPKRRDSLGRALDQRRRPRLPARSRLAARPRDLAGGRPRSAAARRRPDPRRRADRRGRGRGLFGDRIETAPGRLRSRHRHRPRPPRPPARRDHPLRRPGQPRRSGRRSPPPCSRASAPWPGHSCRGARRARSLRRRAAFARRTILACPISPTKPCSPNSTIGCPCSSPEAAARRRRSRRAVRDARFALGWEGRKAVDRLAPHAFETPAGSSHAIDYEAEAGPTVTVRVQALFGLAEHPAVAGGRVPLVLSLTSPAGRPIQTTRDLPGFWSGSWAAVAKEMRGRYPKHPWPDDPAAADPTLRTKKAQSRHSRRKPESMNTAARAFEQPCSWIPGQARDDGDTQLIRQSNPGTRGRRRRARRPASRGGPRCPRPRRRRPRRPSSAPRREAG
jgi:ATP-dependent helicase HrpB